MVNTENFQKFSFAIIILGIFIVVFYSLLPLYLFPNSGLQLVDAITLLLFIVAFFNKNKLPKVIKKQVYAYIPFLVWVIIIIGIYYLAHPQNLNSLKPLLYMAYNFIILYSFTKLFYGMIDKSNYGQFFINLGLIASIFTCFLVKGAYEEAVRNALSFNNPNQMVSCFMILIGYTILFNK